MRFAASACFAVVLLAGNTGCCNLCHPIFPCLHRHCQQECCGMGCQRAPIFNWSHCCDPCDHCGDWAGQGIIARTGTSQDVEYVNNGRRGQPKASMASRVVPGSYREVTREVTEDDEQPAEEEVAEEQVVEEEPVAVAEPPRAKRIRSSKARARQVVRVQRIEG
jgi:hypothetical protein